MKYLKYYVAYFFFVLFLMYGCSRKVSMQKNTEKTEVKTEVEKLAEKSTKEDKEVVVSVEGIADKTDVSVVTKVVKEYSIDDKGVPFVKKETTTKKSRSKLDKLKHSKRSVEIQNTATSDINKEVVKSSEKSVKSEKKKETDVNSVPVWIGLIVLSVFLVVVAWKNLKNKSLLR